MADFNNLYVDVPQTGMAVRRFQTATNFIAPYMAPRKPVGKPSGLYTVWRMSDLNRDELEARGPSAPPKTSTFGRDLVPYVTDVRSLAFDLNAAQQAAADDDSNPEQIIPYVLGYKALISAELRVSQLFFKPESWYRVVTGAANDRVGGDGSTAGQRKYFDDPTTDPITALGDEIRMQGQLTGQDPVAIVFGRRLWHFVRNHPKVRAALVTTTIPVIEARPATLTQMAALLELQWCGVSKAIYNTSLEGEAATNRLIVPPDDALLYYAPSPGTLNADPAMNVNTSTPTSALTKLVWNGVSGVAMDGMQVRTFPDPNAGPGGSMRSVIDVYNGYKVVTREMGTLLRNMVSPAAQTSQSEQAA